MGRDNEAKKIVENVVGFNPRARVGRDPNQRWGVTMSIASFNPRARVGRDVRRSRAALKNISFNPRARVGRDLPMNDTPEPVERFNPRARVGRDAIRVGEMMMSGLFQSTRPRGARLTRPSIAGVDSLVSIHAPAWGATTCEGLARLLVASFNPRARVGRDLTTLTSVVKGSASFNPRARVGRDTGGK